MTKKIILKKPAVDEVISQLTPFVFDEELEAHFDELLERRKSTIHKIQELVKKGTFSAAAVLSVIKKDPEEALNAVISLMGLSQEEFFRHITLIRLDKAASLEDETDTFTSEWKMNRITKELLRDNVFAHQVMDFLFGKTNETMKSRVPRFLLQKLNPRKIQLEQDALIDSLIRIGLKGRYDVKKGQPIVKTAVEILVTLKVEYISGEISVPNVSRKMDIVVPQVSKPLVLVECGVFATTARELSEKALVERQVKQDIQKHYPDAVVVRILDGVGWLARGGNALRDVIATADYVLTGKTIEQFSDIIKAHVPRTYFS